METVEVVIRLPKDMYDRTLCTGVVIVGIDAAYIGGAIIDGIVLPKGHGDLKDVQDIINRINLNYNNHQSIDAYSLKDMIATTRTIIRADEDGELNDS